MRLLLAAILFLFFAIFAPTSHGDRPLLFAKQQQEKIEYLNFKLPLARQQATAPLIKTALIITSNLYFFVTFSESIQPQVLSAKSDFFDLNKLLIFPSSPLVFCEILQV